MYTFDWLAKQAELRTDKIALIDAATNRRYTYAEFHLRASRFAEFLRDEWKIQHGDRVTLLAHNSSDYFRDVVRLREDWRDSSLHELATGRARTRIHHARLDAGGADL